MVREGKQRKRVHPCRTNFPSPSQRDAHARAVHEKWRDCISLYIPTNAPTAAASSRRRRQAAVEAEAKEAD